MRINRKDFIKSLGLGTIGVLAGGRLGNQPVYARQDDDIQTDTIPKRKLGKNGLTASVLCLGMGSRFTSEDFLPAGDRGDYLFYAMDKGINYLDTARNYGPSERILGEILRADDWDKLILSTKTASRTYDGIMEDFNTSRRELKRDYFDVYLLHNNAVAGSVDENVEAFSALLELREQGAVGNIGFSNHGSVSHELAVELVDAFDLDHLVLSVCDTFVDFRPVISDVMDKGCTAAAIKVARIFEGNGPVRSARESYKAVLDHQFSAGIISHSNAGIGEKGWKKVLDENLDTARAFA